MSRRMPLRFGNRFRYWMAAGLLVAACSSTPSAPSGEQDEPTDDLPMGAGGSAAGGRANGTGGNSAGGAGGFGGQGEAPSAGGTGGATGGIAGSQGEGGAPASPPDAGTAPPGTPSANACEDLTCTDFESGSAGPDWLPGSVQFTKEKAAHGQWAAKLALTPNRPSAFMQMSKSLASHKGPLHGRFYMFLSRPHEWGTTWVLRLGMAPTVEFGGKSGTWHLTPLETRERFGTFPSGQWVCVTCSVTEDPVVLTVNANGQRVGQVTVPGSQKVPSYHPLRLGMFQYHPEDITSPVDVYFDDVVVSARPVGCLP